MVPTLSVEQFKKILPKICDKETSSDPNNKWKQENPLWGHCAVVTLIANNLFGGEMLRAEMVGQNDSHYWNKLPYGNEKDFTRDQFGGSYPELANTVVRTRSYVLYDTKTGVPREIMKRYKLLAWRLAKELNEDNILFRDPIYCRCFYNALDSPCKKMKFGAVITHRTGERDSKFVSGECNRTIEPLTFLCEPDCVRLRIPSRTDSAVGACGHAEENALSAVAKMGIPLNECDLYVAGIYPNGLPNIKTQNEFTCLYCARQIYNFGVGRVLVPTISGWQGLSGEECLKTAVAYATGEKKV